ncbi:MAG: RHS repeat domain-containing protein [Francisellaceae bacterium]
MLKREMKKLSIYFFMSWLWLFSQVSSASQLLGVLSYNTIGDKLLSYDGVLSTQDYQYYSNRNKESIEDYEDNKTDYSYDSLGRRQSKSVISAENQSTLTISYSYFGNSDKIKAISNASNHIYYAYTASGKVAMITLSPGDGVSDRIRYFYDPDSGRLLKKMDSDGVSETYTYNANGLSRIIEAQSNGDDIKVSYRYDNFGRRIAILRDDCINSYFSYDGKGRIAEIKIGSAVDEVSIDYQYGYDASGNIATVSAFCNNEICQGSARYSYTYNSIDQLESMTLSGDEILYPKDSYGNAIAARYYTYTQNGDIAVEKTMYADGQYDLAQYVYDTADGFFDRLQQIDHSGDYAYESNLKTHFSDGNYTYNTDGDLIGDPYGDSFVYDGLNELTAILPSTSSVNPVAVQYSYYPTGELASEQSNEMNSADAENNEPVYFYYGGQRDKNGLSAMVKQRQGDIDKYVAPDIGDLLVDQKDEETEKHYLFDDAQGNIIADADDGLLAVYLYLPYGYESDLADPVNSDNNQNYDLDEIKQSFDIENNYFGYDKALLDPASMSLLFGDGYRFYNPIFDAFNKADSFNVFQGVDNVYDFSNDNPIINGDPSGHKSLLKSMFFPLMDFKDSSAEFASLTFASMAGDEADIVMESLSDDLFETDDSDSASYGVNMLKGSASEVSFTLAESASTIMIGQMEQSSSEDINWKNIADNVMTYTTSGAVENMAKKGVMDMAGIDIDGVLFASMIEAGAEYGEKQAFDTKISPSDWTEYTLYNASM